MPARRGTRPRDRPLGRKSVLRKVRVGGVFRNFYLQSYTWEPYFCYTFSLVLQDALAWIRRCTDVNILLFWCISYEYLEFERVLEQS